MANIKNFFNKIYKGKKTKKKKKGELCFGVR